MSKSENNTPAKTYDLITKGVGFLNRARPVNPEGGESYLAVTVAALRGKEPNIRKTYIDCRVVGAQAIAAIKQLEDRINGDEGVFAGFTIGDIEPKLFTYRNGEKKGETGVSAKGRLLRVPFAYVGTEKVFEEQSEENESAGKSDDTPPGEQSASPSAPEEHSADTDDGSASDSDNEPDVVKLSKDDPDFAARKEQLKAAGYKWDREQKAWCKPKAAAA